MGTGSKWHGWVTLLEFRRVEPIDLPRNYAIITLLNDTKHRLMIRMQAGHRSLRSQRSTRHG